MKVLKFKECNCTYAKDQPEYLQLPAFKAEDGEIVTCWRVSIKECIKILFTGRIWLNILTFNKPLQPLKMTCSKPLIK